MPGQQTKRQTGSISLGTLSPVYRFWKKIRASGRVPCGFCSRISSKFFFGQACQSDGSFSTCLFLGLKGPNTGYVSEMNGWNSRVLISRLRVIGATYSQKTKPSPFLSTKNRRMGSYIHYKSTSTLFAGFQGEERTIIGGVDEKVKRTATCTSTSSRVDGVFSRQIVCWQTSVAIGWIPFPFPVRSRLFVKRLKGLSLWVKAIWQDRPAVANNLLLFETLRETGILYNRPKVTRLGSWSRLARQSARLQRDRKSLCIIFFLFVLLFFFFFASYPTIGFLWSDEEMLSHSPLTSSLLPPHLTYSPLTLPFPHPPPLPTFFRPRSGVASKCESTWCFTPENKKTMLTARKKGKKKCSQRFGHWTAIGALKINPSLPLHETNTHAHHILPSQIISPMPYYTSICHLHEERKERRERKKKKEAVCPRAYLL